MWTLPLQAGESLWHRKPSDFIILLLELDSYQFNGKNGRETLATEMILRQQMCNSETTILFFYGLRPRNL